LRLSGGDAETADAPEWYGYRQPGFLHGPFAFPYYGGGLTLLQRYDRPLRILRYHGTKYPRKDGQPVTDEHENWPVDQGRVDTAEVPWVEVTQDGWAGASYKWLRRNRATNGGVIMIQIPPGWKGAGTPGREVVEEFVAHGSLIAGGEHYVRWGYACRPAGDPAGEYESKEGATLFCWWERDEFE
jgi:hypothetical protein